MEPKEDEELPTPKRAGGRGPRTSGHPHCTRIKERARDANVGMESRREERSVEEGGDDDDDENEEEKEEEGLKDASFRLEVSDCRSEQTVEGPMKKGERGKSNAAM